MPPIQPTHKAIAAYYGTLADLSSQGIVNEGGLRRAFSAMLATLGRAEGWTLAEEQTLPGRIRPDGVLLDEFRFPRGYWEAKDSADDLEVEMRKKFERGYPQTNIIFEDGRRAVLVQNRRRSAEADMADRVQLANLLAQFFGHTEENVAGFHAAVREFQARIPDLARSVEQIIEEERSKNQRFAGAFDAFHTICRQAIDPNIGADEWRVEKMKLSADKTSLVVNPSLTLAGIPPECLRYRLGNRSALEWVIDQYQVSTDKRSGIVSDPNRSDDEEYIVRLVGRVISVSIETMRIVDALPPLGVTEG